MKLVSLTTERVKEGPRLIRDWLPAKLVKMLALIR